MRKGLESSALLVLRRASEKGVELAFDQLGPYFKRGLWVGQGNRYRIHCVKRAVADDKNHRLNSRHLAQYVAASTILHCSDGWSFLGRALQCHAMGDNDASRHLAYYAELRGAVSLLASQGKVVLDKRHFIVDPSAACQLYCQGSTHNIAWYTLQHWANLKSSNKLLSDIIRSNGKTLHQWLEAFGCPEQYWPIGIKWLKRWGLDLHRLLTKDRFDRNEASYRPTRMNQAESLTPNKAWGSLCQFWNPYEPSSTSPFERLDRFLIRLSLETAYKTTTGNDPATHRRDFTRRVSEALRLLGFTPNYARELRRFMIRLSDGRDPAIIEDARASDPISHPRHHLEVIGRASLLLRIATGAAARLLRDSQFVKKDLRFWWESFGESRGLWIPKIVPANFEDLWLDISDALNQRVLWDKMTKSQEKTKYSLAKLHGEQSDSILVLSECERICLWGLDLREKP